MHRAWVGEAGVGATGSGRVVLSCIGTAGGGWALCSDRPALGLDRCDG
jgi:hypothetical protein